MGAASARIHELSKYWVAQGHHVTVLTSFPNYPDGVIYDEYKSKSRKLIMREGIDGIEVIRVFTITTHLRSSFRRGLYYISFFLTSLLVGLFIKKYDLIIATSPSLFVGLTGLTVSRVKKVPFVFEVRDLWPEIMTAVGVAGKNSITYRLFDKIAETLYLKSDLIITVTSSFKDVIASCRSIPQEKIKIIENAVDTDFFKPFKVLPEDINKLGLENKFVVSYVGTIGYTHGVEVILDAALVLKDEYPDILFLIVGSGSDKERLSKMAAEKGLQNVLFTGKQPKSKIPTYINASNVSLILSSKSELLKKTIFAKLFEPMACGKPIVVGAEGETKNIIIEKANAGLYFEPENVKGLIESITILYKNQNLRESLGNNGRIFVTEHFSRSKKADEYLKILESLVEKRKYGNNR